VGSHSVAASYLGSVSFLTSSGSLAGNQSVNASSTTTTLASSVNPSAFGQSETFTVTEAAAAPGSGVRAGNIQIVVDGGNDGRPVALEVSGQATLSISLLSVGSHSVAASYLGSARFLTSNGSLAGNQSVNASSTTTTLASSVSPSAFGQ